MCESNYPNSVMTYLALQEEEDSGLDEVGVGALSASPLGGTFLLWFSLAEQSVRTLKHELANTQLQVAQCKHTS